jgi:hypothetical protein
MSYSNITSSAVIISYIHDDHRKLTFTTSFILPVLQKELHVTLSVVRYLVTRLLYTFHSVVIRPRLEGGDPAAGSPTATLLRLLPRC